MNRKPAIEAAGIGKKFFLHTRADQTFSRSVLGKVFGGGANTRALWAVRDINLSVSRGECLGLIGPNGAGKSTLLMILAGILLPTEGSVIIRGKVTPFFHIGSGLHSDLTVLDNIRLTAALLGMTTPELRGKLDSIVSFGGLDEYLHARLGELSSGYQARIPFSTALHSDTAMLLIDEVFTVGDEAFRAKCLECMRGLQKKGKTMILASHDLQLIRDFCSRAIYLKSGRLVMEGTPDAVIQNYLQTMHAHLQ